MKRFAILMPLFLSSVFSAARGEDAVLWKPGLSDRELAIQRWFSGITYGSDRTAKEWPVFADDGKQFDLKSLRYQLAFGGYGCALMGAKTPAYREVIHEQLDDICQRMIDRRVWHFVTHYWEYGDDPPDPCRFENVMYTGHLTQLMCLQELLTGDRRYSTEGWDFVWSDGRSVHYDLEKAVARMHSQSLENNSGGICCEPGLVFAVCNNHSSNSYTLFDLLNGTNYSEVNEKWFDWMRENFRNQRPKARELLYVIYRRNEEKFLKIGDVGADCWALGWGYPWHPTTEFAKAGWKHTVENARWSNPQPDQRFVVNNPLFRTQGATLGAANSFLALLAKQIEGPESQIAQGVIRWFDANFGKRADLDGDGHAESYWYDTDDGYHIPATGNLAAALATDGDSLRQLFHTPRHDIISAPSLTHVDYPNVYVRQAEYASPVLRFTVLKGVPGFAGTTELECGQILGPATVTRDGAPYTDFRRDGANLVIRSDVDREHVFEVRLDRPAVGGG